MVCLKARLLFPYFRLNKQHLFGSDTLSMNMEIGNKEIGQLLKRSIFFAFLNTDFTSTTSQTFGKTSKKVERLKITGMDFAKMSPPFLKTLQKVSLLWQFYCTQYCSLFQRLFLTNYSDKIRNCKSRKILNC